jgi:DNA-binding MarR family transcriptional regulator
MTKRLPRGEAPLVSGDVCRYLWSMSTRASKPAIPAQPCVCLRLRKAARRVSQIYDQHLEPYGLSITQYGLLSHLRVLDGISVSALAETLVMDPTTLSRSLKPLERRCWVKTKADKSDRRVRTMHLTTKGQDVVNLAKPGWDRAQREIATAFGDTDSAALAAAVDRLIFALAD